MKTERIVIATVQLAIAVPADADDENAHACVVDTVNETLRKHQRTWNAQSFILDYAIDSQIRDNAADPDNYDEGDAF